MVNFTDKEATEIEKALITLKQALAEKEREIAKWKELIGAFTQSEHNYLKNHEQLKKAHHALLAQAVRFAKQVCQYSCAPLCDEAQAFLKEHP